MRLLQDAQLLLSRSKEILWDEKECREWLKVGEKAGTLVTREHAMADDDLASVRGKEWFKEIKSWQRIAKNFYG